MHIIALFFLLPLVVGTGIQYASCRFPRKRFWRYLPVAAVAVLAVGVALFRWWGWDPEGGGAPVETLLFVPGLPALGALLGLLVGFRLWKWLWTPRIWHRG